MKIPIFTGPTAVGKSEFAVFFAKKVNTEIISIDSMQTRRYMNIGTAKIKEEEKKGIVHHLMDIVDPDEEFDVKRFREMALSKIDEIVSKGKTPVLVGGSGLYIEALKYGIFEGPSKNAELRFALQRLEEIIPGTLRKLLKSVDREAYGKFNENDLLRTIRALEVYILSGEKISVLWRKRKEDERFIIFVMNLPRQELYQRINERVEKMFQEGFIEEVRGLLKMGYSKDLPAMGSIGYREVVKYLEGEFDLKECKEEIKKETRHFAKRQLTWFRKYKDAVWLDMREDREKLFEKVIENMKV